jgi:hypothetical protein
MDSDCSTNKTIPSIDFSSNSEDRTPAMRSGLTSDNLRLTHIKHVRFDIDGVEVLPTSSPPTTSRSKPQTFSVDSHETEGRPLSAVLQEDNAEEAKHTSQAEVDIEKMGFRSKKRPSITEALRRLSSQLVENPEDWITVNGDEVSCDTSNDADETESSRRERLAIESPSMNSGSPNTLAPNLEVEDCNMSFLEEEEGESRAQLEKYPPEEEHDEDGEIEASENTDLADGHSQGVPIPRLVKATSSRFTLPLGAYNQGPLYFTPFNGQRLHCGVPAKASDTCYASSLSERLAREEQQMGDMDETAQDLDSASMSLEISHEFTMSRGLLIDRKYSKPLATHR